MITTQRIGTYDNAIPPASLLLTPPQNRRFGVYYPPDSRPHVCEVISASRDGQRYVVCRIPNCKFSIDSDGTEIAGSQFHPCPSYGEAMQNAERLMSQLAKQHTDENTPSLAGQSNS